MPQMLFLATKISFINEIANLCENTNIDVKEISHWNWIR